MTFFFFLGLLTSAVSNSDLGLTSFLCVVRVRTGADLRSRSWVPDYWPGACECVQRQMSAKFSVRTDLMRPIVMVLSISGYGSGIGRSGAWRWRCVNDDSEVFSRAWQRVHSPRVFSPSDLDRSAHGLSKSDVGCLKQWLETVDLRHETVRHVEEIPESSCGTWRRMRTWNLIGKLVFCRSWSERLIFVISFQKKKDLWWGAFWMFFFFKCGSEGSSCSLEL